ncbi:hypothetical protein [Acetobacter sp.]|uniref:hypothetical protein n=1 Tax=Acetobacter sp. TaxID=440 RepID=UPI0039EBA6C3
MNTLGLTPFYDAMRKVMQQCIIATRHKLPVAKQILGRIKKRPRIELAFCTFIQKVRDKIINVTIRLRQVGTVPIWFEESRISDERRVILNIFFNFFHEILNSSQSKISMPAFTCTLSMTQFRFSETQQRN